MRPPTQGITAIEQQLAGIARRRIVVRYVETTDPEPPHVLVNILAMAAPTNQDYTCLVTLNYRSVLHLPNKAGPRWSKVSNFRPKCEVKRPWSVDSLRLAVSITLNSWLAYSPLLATADDLLSISADGDPLTPGSLPVLMALAGLRAELINQITTRNDAQCDCQFMLTRLQGLIDAKLAAWHELTGIPV